MDGLRLIDLPEDMVGSDCVICEAMGARVTARFLDREGAAVCEVCFSELLRLEVLLMAVGHHALTSAATDSGGNRK